MGRARNRVTGFISLFLMMCITVLGVASQFTFVSNAQPEEKRVVRIGYIDYEGYIVEEDGSYSGYGVDYLTRIAEYTGWEYEYVFGTWDEHMESLLDGTIDFLCHAQITPARIDDYIFSKYSIGDESSILYVKRDDDRYYYNDYENFDGMTIAVMSGSYQNEVFEEYSSKKGFHCTYQIYESEGECFEALERGEVDGVAMGSLAIQEGYKVACRFSSDPFYFISGRQNTELMEEMNLALGELNSAEPTLKTELYEKYYGGSQSDLAVPFTREEVELIREQEVIEVGFIPNRTPFSWENEAGEPEGITVDIMDLIAEKSGLQFNYVMMEVGETTTAFLERNPDALIAGVMTQNPAFQNETYLLSDNFYTDDVALATRAGMNYDLYAPEASYTLAIPKSYMALRSYILDNYPQFEIIQCDTTKECMQRVLRGEVDFLAQNINVITPLLQDPHNEGMIVLPTFFMDEYSGTVCRNSDRNVIITSILNKCIATITEKELSQFTVNHTVTNGYRMSIGDLLYKFRYPFMLIGFLLLACLGMMGLYTGLKRKSVMKLEEKNEQLADAVCQADNANRAKSQFLARMSHEIRTPMNAIVGLTSIAKHHEGDPEKIDEYLTKIDTSSKVLLSIINDVLDMSAIESNKLRLAHNPFDIRELMTALSNMYYSQCRQKGIRFEMDTSQIIDEHLIGDGLRVNQILLNLISNAYKFTPSGGKITISVEEVSQKEDKAYFNFIVTDTGEGMSEEMQERLFKPFEQENASTAKLHGGSGLGLSIAKNLVEMMQGKISFSSVKNVGTTFTVSLPFEIDHAIREISDKQLKSIRALIVDDEEETCEYTSVILKRIGVPFDIATSGKEAVEKLQQAKEIGSGYDICFVDWKMPDMSGVEVTNSIREMFEKNSLVIIVSAYDTSEIEDEALAVGADMFISKPLFQSTVFNLLMQLSGGQYVNQTENAEAYDFHGKRALLAEDNEFNAEIAMELLQMANLQVDRAANGREAVAMFEAADPGTYSLILMDVQMPEMDGFEATQRIRNGSHAEAKTIPIFAMTANAFTEDISASLNAGMNGHIAKPIDTRVLYGTVNKVING